MWTLGERFGDFPKMAGLHRNQTESSTRQIQYGGLKPEILKKTIGSFPHQVCLQFHTMV